MALNTGIKWTDHTFNPWHGCTKVSPGCDFCYAEIQAARFQGAQWGQAHDRRTFGNRHWKQLHDIAALAKKTNKTQLVFVASMSDLADNHPSVENARQKFWGMAREFQYHHNVIFQVLTKRPKLLKEQLPQDWFDGYANVWLGVSVESQQYVWRIKELLDIPASLRFVSVEPLLERVEPEALAGVDWAILGGESGAHARTFDMSNAIELQMYCVANGIKVFFKQVGTRLAKQCGFKAYKGDDSGEWGFEYRQEIPMIYTAAEVTQRHYAEGERFSTLEPRKRYLGQGRDEYHFECNKCHETFPVIGHYIKCNGTIIHLCPYCRSDSQPFRYGRGL